MNPCEICEEIKTSQFILAEKSGIDNRIIFETSSFVIVPGLGPIVEGYLLIFTKEHHYSISSLSDKQLIELEEVKKVVSDKLFKKYGKVLFFEHGMSCETKRAGACIDHCHLHAIPIEKPILPVLNNQLNFFPIEDFKHLKELTQNEPYLFLEENEKKYVCQSPVKLPSQFIRRVIAKELGKEEYWDWGAHYGFKEMENCLKELRGNP